MASLKYLAPAKLNLFLHITGRRADGYHCLQTIFQFLDYGDDLIFTPRADGQLLCTSNAPNLPPEQDLTLRAARLLRAYTQTSFGANIQVNKRIPMGGGLGGGSSDAATTLLALNTLWNLGLERDELANVGRQLGADVPIFVYGQAAWAEGVGDVFTPIDDLAENWYVVIYPACHVPTKEIFTDADLTRNQPTVTMRDFIAGRCTNICEPVVSRRYPAVGAALAWLRQQTTAHLTGTGSCIFAALETEAEAKYIAQQVPAPWQVFVARGCNTSPAMRSQKLENLL